MKKSFSYKFIFAGGGTGGHLYPAIAVAQKIKMLIPDADILFVGTKNKIEANVVPSLGFKFRTIWISGFSRKITLRNIFFPIKVIVSMIQSLIINFSFKPKVAVGTGAYVSGPVIWAASIIGAKVILLEQNSFPGITNRILEKRAERIHITFKESGDFFRFKDKLVVSGNPVRIDMIKKSKEEAVKHFGLSTERKILFVTGGSLGAASINKAVGINLNDLIKLGISIIWQTGKNYYSDYKKYESDKVKVLPFVDKVSNAYSCADLVLARAGATTIAEISQLGLAAILVPSPNVAANHQFKNAEVLEKNNAVILIKDDEISNMLLLNIKENIFNEDKLSELKTNIVKFAKPDAVEEIAQDAIRLAESR